MEERMRFRVVKAPSIITTAKNIELVTGDTVS